ncbi:hypothetical protein [Streptomyces sp. NPDC058955]|uniref:hypothetical protein n=1 Tax=unclassified Streptomyces TaxID=2593676 RepID=UPI00364F609E
MRPGTVAMSSGSGVVRGNHRFDLEAGIEATGMGRADVWWRQLPGGGRELVPLLGARLCPMGVIGYDPLAHQDLATLSYHADAVPGGPEGENRLTAGSVVAVRTRSGRFVKLQVQTYGQDLRIRWQACPPPPQYKTLKVLIGDQPAWLVRRYTVDCGYQSPDGSVQPCGSAEFGYEGGVLEDRISDTGGGFPAAVRVAIGIDFRPETGLPVTLRQFAPEVGPSGASLVYEPSQEIRRIALVFGLDPRPLPQDHLLLRWTYRSGSAAGAGGRHTLSGADLQQSAVQHEIAFPPDGSASASVDLVVDGLYQGAELVQFTQNVALPANAIAFRFKKQGAGPRYRLEAF